MVTAKSKADTASNGQARASLSLDPTELSTMFSPDPEPVKHKRAASAVDSTIRPVLEASQQSGQAYSMPCPNETDATLLTAAARRVAAEMGIGLKVSTDNGVFKIQAAPKRQFKPRTDEQKAAAAAKRAAKKAEKANAA